VSQGTEGQHVLARLPWGIIATTAVICGIGVMNLSSAAQATRPDLYLLQLGYMMAATVFGAIVARTRMYVLEAGAYPLYVVVNTLLILVLVAGTTVKGAQRWLDLGVIMLQPSEIAKIAIILATARYFSRYRVEGGFTLRGLIRPLNLSRPLGVGAFLLLRWHKQARSVEEALVSGELLEKAPDPTWLKVTLFVVVIGWIAIGVLVLLKKGMHHRRLLAPLDVVLLPWGLIVVEPDLGTSLIVLAIAGTQILFCGMRRSSLLIAAVGVTVTAVFGWNFLLKDYQKKRVETFLDPEADLQGAGYHAAQSMIAIGSGQLTGKGYGEGTQTQLSFLPENHTDFVFSVLAEEWGLVGASTLILLFLLLVLLLLRDARAHTDRFAVLVNVGSAAMIFWHVLINIGMVTALMPVVGMTLPLVSYGGSSLVTQVACIAFAVNTRIWGRS
jgi:cell division protein FtsW (lipid II flippase)